MVENNELPDDPKRWTATRKATVVIEIIKGRTTPSEVSRTYGLTVLEVEGWIADFVSAGTEGLRACPRGIQTQYEAKLKDAHAKIGELSLAVEVLKKRIAISESGFRTGSLRHASCRSKCRWEGYEQISALSNP